MSEIAKWFSGKSVFVTGATGFVGKCVVEKLLYDCPDIGNIYIMIRNKRGQNFEQRKCDYAKHIVFTRLRETKPNVLNKIKIVQGDLNEPKLGISDADRELIAKTVTVVFHSAADVHFDMRLIDAYYSNYNGTKKMLEFASEFDHVDVSFFHQLHYFNINCHFFRTALHALMQ